MWRELFKLPLTANIIDIGGGDSHFVDALLEKGYQNIWVLDISEMQKTLEKFWSPPSHLNMKICQHWN